MNIKSLPQIICNYLELIPIRLQQKDLANFAYRISINFPGGSNLHTKILNRSNQIRIGLFLRQYAIKFSLDPDE